MGIIVLDYVSLFFGVTGVFLAILFYIKSKKNKVLVYLTQSFSLISKEVTSIENFSAQYNGKPLESLSVTNVMFWNYGNTTIDGSDIASLDNLVFELAKGVLILDSQVIKSSKEANGVKINANANVLYFDFDYIEPKQGFVVRVLHTGEGFLVHGTVKGGSLKRFNNSRNLRHVLSLVGLFIAALLVLYMLIFGATSRIFEAWLWCILVGSFLLIPPPSSKLNGMKVDKDIEVAFKGKDG